MPALRRLSWRILLPIAVNVCLVHAHAAAQDRPARLTWSAAYFGELLLHPGAVIGADYPLAQGRIGSSAIALIAAANFGSYVHPRNHVGAMLDAEAGGRIAFSCGVLLEAFVGLGYLHTVLAAPLYEVSDTGEVSRHTDLGRPAFMPVASVGTGWQLRGFAPFLRLQGFGQYPFNQHLLPHFALLLGTRF
jgi:hypothetical protein